MIVDEFTGRMMPSRRWSDGLHQAVEAKENVDIEEENAQDTIVRIIGQDKLQKTTLGEIAERGSMADCMAVFNPVLDALTQTREGLLLEEMGKLLRNWQRIGNWEALSGPSGKSRYIFSYR